MKYQKRYLISNQIWKLTELPIENTSQETSVLNKSQM